MKSRERIERAFEATLIYTPQRLASVTVSIRSRCLNSFWLYVVITVHKYALQIHREVCKIFHIQKKSLRTFYIVM